MKNLKGTSVIYKLIFDTSTDAIVVADDGGQYIDANPAACNLLGYDMDEFLKLKVFDIVVDERLKFKNTEIPSIQLSKSKEIHKHGWYEFLENGNEQGIIFCKRKDGSIIKLEYNAIRDVTPGHHVSFMRRVDSLESIINKMEAGELRSQALIKAFPDLLFVIDYAGKYIDFLAGKETLLFLPKENFIGKYVSDLLPAELALEFHSRVRKIIETGEDQFLDYSLEINGKRLFFEGKLIQYKDSELLYVARDITRIKKQEIEYQELSSKFEAIIKSIPDMLFVVDKHGTFKDFFVRDENQLAISKDKIIGSSLFDIFPAEQVDFHLNHYQIALQTRLPRIFEYNMQDAEQNRVFEARICPINDTDVLSIVRDITEIHITEKALRESEERFRNIFENATLGIFQTTLEGRILKANDALARILGFDNAGQLMKDVSNVRDLYVNPDDRNRFIETISQNGEVLNFEFRTRKRDGSLIFTNTSARLVRSHHKGMDFIEGFNQDVTTQKEQNEYQKQMEVKEKASLLKDQFLANVSHEIRTPVTGIIGMTEILKNTKLDENQSKYLNVINDSSRILLDLINDILDLAKIEARQMILFPELIEPREFLQNIYRMFEFNFLEKGVAFDFQISEDMPGLIRVDSRRLKQILINLITNAMKFTQKGYVQVRFDYKPAKDENHIILVEIEDTGPGIPENDQSTIFEKFQQMNSSFVRTTPGTGLGLAISKELVALLGGEIGLKSIPGKGSTFWFTFRVGSDTRKKQPVSEHQAPHVKDIKFEANVLVAEDKVTNQMVIKLLLESLGCRVTLAKNGIEALEEYEKEKFDLVFMDISMPEMDGFAALYELNERYSSRCPVVVLSANNMQGAGQQYINSGFDDFLSKPYTANDLREILMKWIPNCVVRK
jgi:PAS domain S-box-containing protein